MQASRSPALRQSRFTGSAAVVTANRSLLIGRHAAAAQRPSRHICNAAAVQIQAGLQQLLNWAASNKAVVDKVTIADDIATDQPVYVAAKDVAAGEQVFAVPESAWLTTSSAQQSSIGKYITGLEPWLQLALLLLAERSQPGGSSKLGPYLAAAADSSSTLMRSPLFWSEDELQLLQGTQLLESVRGYK
jgi:[ribulose-bisphosphate carboxylase]-lysine N-methyltransferase